MGAYAEDRFTTIALCEGQARWHTLQSERCLACGTGKVANPYIPTAEPWRVPAACGRACVAHLEDQGKLSRRFVHAFREAPRK